MIHLTQMTYTNNLSVERKCCITREKHPKNLLFRLNKGKNNEIRLDLDYELKGRGYYIKKDFNIVNRSRKALPNITKCDVDESIFEEMINNLK